jgi:ribosomal protein L19E
MATRKVGRDAGSGKFKTVAAARRDKKGSVVETIKVTRKPKKK